MRTVKSVLGDFDNLGRCRCGGKVKFGTKSPALALSLLLRAVAKRRVAGGRETDCSVYRCPTCKLYCTSTVPQRGSKNTIVTYNPKTFKSEQTLIEALADHFRIA